MRAASFHAAHVEVTVVGVQTTRFGALDHGNARSSDDDAAGRLASEDRPTARRTRPPRDQATRAIDSYMGYLGMKSIVVYSTRSGNTRRVAAAIAEVLRAHGQVDLLAAESAPRRLAPGTDLLVVGGPTEGHGMTPPIERFLEYLELTAIDGIAVAVFDTRLRWPKMLSGSAADRIAKRLTTDGATLVVPPESFLVTRKPELEDGELPRATAWATTLVEAVSARASLQPQPQPLPR